MPPTEEHTHTRTNPKDPTIRRSSHSGCAVLHSIHSPWPIHIRRRHAIAITAVMSAPATLLLEYATLELGEPVVPYTSLDSIRPRRILPAPILSQVSPHASMAQPPPARRLLAAARSPPPVPLCAAAARGPWMSFIRPDLGSPTLAHRPRRRLRGRRGQTASWARA